MAGSGQGQARALHSLALQMGATTSGGSVVETIRQQLAAGYTGDQVVDGVDLVDFEVVE